MVKGFGMAMDYVLYELSYANLIMLSATLPSYSNSDTPPEEERLDMSDPQDQKKIDALLGIGGGEE